MDTEMDEADALFGALLPATAALKQGRGQASTETEAASDAQKRRRTQRGNGGQQGTGATVPAAGKGRGGGRVKGQGRGQKVRGSDGTSEPSLHQLVTQMARLLLLTALHETMQLVKVPEALTRFQSTRPMTADMTGEHIPWLIDVSLRHSRLHELMHSLTHMSVMHLIGGRVRAARAKRNQQQEQLAQMLRSA